MTRPGLLLLLVLLLWLGASAANAGVQVFSVEIQVPGASRPVRLAPADADAFQRRLAVPPPYVGPIPTGDSYLVTSAYWDAVLGSGVNAPPVEAAVTYFPVGGIVRARQANRDAHFVLDLRQRAMLDRYIRVAREGSLSSTPGALQVLAAASLSETIGVDVAGKPFDADGPRGFWSALRSGNPPPVFNDPPKPPVAATGYWFAVTAPEGRAISYFNDTAQQSLTDALGTETYDARNLAAIGVLPPPSEEPPRIAQQAPQGSLLWWPVMLGSGAALIGAAVWLRRRYP